MFFNIMSLEKFNTCVCLLHTHICVHVCNVANFSPLSPRKLGLSPKKHKGFMLGGRAGGERGTYHRSYTSDVSTQYFRPFFPLGDPIRRIA